MLTIKTTVLVEKSRRPSQSPSSTPSVRRSQARRSGLNPPAAGHRRHGDGRRNSDRCAGCGHRHSRRWLDAGRRAGPRHRTDRVVQRLRRRVMALARPGASRRRSDITTANRSKPGSWSRFFRCPDLGLRCVIERIIAPTLCNAGGYRCARERKFWGAVVALAVGVITSVASVALGGPLDPPGPPSSTGPIVVVTPTPSGEVEFLPVTIDCGGVSAELRNALSAERSHTRELIASGWTLLGPPSVTVLHSGECAVLYTFTRPLIAGTATATTTVPGGTPTQTPTPLATATPTLTPTATATSATPTLTPTPTP